MNNHDGARRRTQSISINATPEKVWDLITRIDTVGDWYDTWDRVDPVSTEPHLRAGMSFRLIRRHTGRDDEVAQCEVTELSEHTRLQCMPHRPTTGVTFDLVTHPTDGTTELRQTRSWRTP